MTTRDQLMVEARRVLLDSLDALVVHRASLVLVGAQAIYLRTAEVELSFSSSYTTDADLVLDPTTLADHPDIHEVMISAGFVPIQPSRPGIWGKIVTIAGENNTIPVDLIVPRALAGSGSRGADLGRHGNRVASIALGLEAAIIDRSPLTIPALDPADPRTATIGVAGPTALLIAKLHKIRDRLATAETRPDRLIAKDAADCYRLMLHLNPQIALGVIDNLLANQMASATTANAIGYLRDLFVAPLSPGTRLAVEALAADVPSERVEAVCTIFAAAVTGPV